MAERAACIIGYPVGHSRSPKLHGYWIKQHGLDAEYRAEEVSPDAFPDFVSHLADRGYVGANVTMPHKDAALLHSSPDDRAKSVGAANTLWLDNGTLRSTNTDVDGFVSALDVASPGWHERTETAIVLGAGGGSRAAIYGLLDRGIREVTVVNRTFSKATELQKAFGSAVVPGEWDRLSDHLSGARLLVNTTSLGMHGQPPLEIDLSVLAENAVVSDIVYIPLKTPLLRAAEDRGFAVANGLDMLLHQAVRGFELWFGIRPSVTQDLRDMLAADIAQA